MKKIIMVLGVVALLAVAAVSMGVANAKPGGQELKVDALITTISPGPSPALAKGATLYVEFDLFRQGDAGNEVVGEGDFMGMSTAGNVSEAMGLFVYRLDGKGDIHVSSGAGTGLAPEGRIGAIIGGTGIYRGVTGEYHHKAVGGGEIHITFKFNSGKN